MKPRIALFGGSFNPPGLYHVRIAEELRRHFDLVLVVPCGPRPDRPTTNAVDPVHRATMADIAFRGMKGVEVDLFDLERPIFTRNLELEARFRDRGDLWHVVSSDFVKDGARGDSVIHRTWESGPETFRTLKFAVVARTGQPLDRADLPPHNELFDVDRTDESFTLRERVFHGEPVSGLVPDPVLAYIERYGLYRGTVPSRATRLELSAPRLMIVSDERNGRAMAFAKTFRQHENAEDPNCILVIGGDGSMLHAIQQHWRRRVPFFGVNAGHLGFLLNDPSEVMDRPFPPSEMLCRRMPLLHVEMQGLDGVWRSGLTFNDAWVERASGQSAWLQVTVGDRVRLPKLVCDGLLVSTPAGSTAYARSMGATPLLADTPAFLVVGSNVAQPPGWKSALLSEDVTIEVRNLDPDKRPINAYLHGTTQGEVLAMRARLSRVGAVELAFVSGHDMAEKIAAIQFPPTGGPI